jgi:DNA topoisomerase-3
MRILCVAEKPSMAKSLAQLLSAGACTSRPGKHRYCKNFDFVYRFQTRPCPEFPQGDVSITMTSVLGHLYERDFEGNVKSWSAFPPEILFESEIIQTCSKEMNPVFENLKYECKNAQGLILWTDCDREGEHIGFEIAQICHSIHPSLIVKRARFSVIQARELHHAMQTLQNLDMKAISAVTARMEVDLRVGAALTRFLTMRFRNRFEALQNRILSYGGCQFPTLGFVVEAYRRVQSFIPENFWHICVTVPGNANDMEQFHEPCKPVNFIWDRGHIFDELIAFVLFEPCVQAASSPDQGARITRVEKKSRTRRKPIPLTTVELQKLGVKMLKMTSSAVMTSAENLYRNGLISYPRTETNEFEVKDEELRRLVALQTNDEAWGSYATHLLEADSVGFQRPRSGGQNDKAHPPIHPTRGVGPGLDVNDRRVYELIARRFLACCSKDATGSETIVHLALAEESFHASGLMVEQRNYLDVYPYDRWGANEQIIPPFVQGQQVFPSTVDLVQGTTSPPSLLTEAELIGLMDSNGIGTDATIHEHIAKVIERSYVIPEGNFLVPSTLGLALVQGFDNITSQSLAKPYLRAKMEADLLAICNGTKQHNEVVRSTLREYRALYRRTVIQAWIVEDELTKMLGAEPADLPPLPRDAGNTHRLAPTMTAGRGARGSRGTRGSRTQSTRPRAITRSSLANAPSAVANVNPPVAGRTLSSEYRQIFQSVRLSLSPPIQ